MALMKIAGKQLINATTADTTLTFTAGAVTDEGQEVASTAYAKSNKFAVSAGQVVDLVNASNGTAYGARYVTAYYNDTPVPSESINSPSRDIVHYIVPSGVNQLIISVSNTVANITPVARITTEVAMARSFSVDKDGVLNVHHVWESTPKTICSDVQIRDTDAHVFPESGVAAVDISDYAITSLRISNAYDVPIQIRFYGDNLSDATAGGSWLSDKNNTVFVFNVPNGNAIAVLTPEDFPPLYYLRRLRVRVNCETAPTSGSLSITAICRR